MQPPELARVREGEPQRAPAALGPDVADGGAVAVLEAARVVVRELGALDGSILAAEPPLDFGHFEPFLKFGAKGAPHERYVFLAYEDEADASGKADKPAGRCLTHLVWAMDPASEEARARGLGGKRSPAEPEAFADLTGGLRRIAL